MLNISFLHIPVLHHHDNVQEPILAVELKQVF